MNSQQNRSVHRYTKFILLFALVLLAKAGGAQTLLKLFPKGDKPNALLFITLTFAALLITLAIHELAHLLTGLAQGFRFEMFVVGPFGFRRSANKVGFYFNKNLGMMGGVAVTVPVRQDERNTQKFARLILAGPLASLVFGIISFLLFFQIDSGAARLFWFLEGTSSLGIFIVTTIPTRSGPFFTDRARYQRLVSKGKASRVETAMLSLLAQSTMDGHYKNIDPDKARLLQTDDDAFMRFWGHYFEFHFYKDHSLIPEAKVVREQLVAQKSSMTPQLWKTLKMDEYLALPDP